MPESTLLPTHTSTSQDLGGQPPPVLFFITIFLSLKKMKKSFVDVIEFFFLKKKLKSFS